MKRHNTCWCLCLTTHTLCISWISEMQQKATKHCRTQGAQKMFLHVCVLPINCWLLNWLLMFQTVQLEKGFSSEVLHEVWCFFYRGWVSFLCIVVVWHTHLQLLNHRKVHQKWGNVGMINKFYVCMSDVVSMWIKWGFINSPHTLDQFRSM